MRTSGGRPQLECLCVHSASPNTQLVALTCVPGSLFPSCAAHTPRLSSLAGATTTALTMTEDMGVVTSASGAKPRALPALLLCSSGGHSLACHENGFCHTAAPAMLLPLAPVSPAWYGHSSPLRRLLMVSREGSAVEGRQQRTWVMIWWVRQLIPACLKPVQRWPSSLPLARADLGCRLPPPGSAAPREPAGRLGS